MSCRHECVARTSEFRSNTGRRSWTSPRPACPPFPAPHSDTRHLTTHPSLHWQSQHEYRENKRVLGVKWGFKAPVSMLLVPFLKEMAPGGLKFLHVVRDGRDIAFSGNKTPVSKFYPAYRGISKEQHNAMSSECGSLSGAEADKP